LGYNQDWRFCTFTLKSNSQKVYLRELKSDTELLRLPPIRVTAFVALRYLPISFYWGFTFMEADEEKVIYPWTSEDW
jgi:hypothetical protein